MSLRISILVPSKQTRESWLSKRADDARCCSLPSAGNEGDQCEVQTEIAVVGVLTRIDVVYDIVGLATTRMVLIEVAEANIGSPRTVERHE